MELRWRALPAGSAIRLVPPTLIQSDVASIRRLIFVNECGAY